MISFTFGFYIGCLLGVIVGVLLGCRYRKSKPLFPQNALLERANELIEREKETK